MKKDCDACGNPPDVMTVDQAARYIQVSRSKMDQLIESGEIPAKNINEGGIRKIYRIAKTALDEYVQKNHQAV